MGELVEFANSGETSIDTLILVTTSRCGQRTAELVRLAASVDLLHLAKPNIQIRHYLLLQDSSASSDQAEALRSDGHWLLHETEERISLSMARNRILAKIGVMPERAVVAFPDDDAWYAEGALEQVFAVFDDDRTLDLFICKSGPHPCLPIEPKTEVPRLQQVISNATSNTIFVRAALVTKMGPFDEALGLGTPAVSGEDTDYALRAFRLGRGAAFLPYVAVGHRAPDSRDREEYFSGAFYAIARHATGLHGGHVALARKLLIGFFLTAKGRITPTRFLTDLAKAFAYWRSGFNLDNKSRKG